MSSAKSERVILIGFMATGKTAVGRLLARRLGWRHVDCDALIERGERMTVRRIFEKKGEAHFRRAESAALRRALSRRRTVVSAGGGIVLSARNRALIRSRGFAVWLRSPVREVLSRAKGKSRPLLAVKDPRAEASRLLKRRAPLYRACADTAVRSGEEPLARIVGRIIKIMEKRNAAR